MRTATLGLCMLLASTSVMNAEEVLPKRTLKGNSTLVDNILPPKVGSLGEMFGYDTYCR